MVFDCACFLIQKVHLLPQKQSLAPFPPVKQIHDKINLKQLRNIEKTIAMLDCIALQSSSPFKKEKKVSGGVNEPDQ